MTLGNMREHGVGSVAAHCQELRCGRSGSVNVDHLLDELPVPDLALHLRCSACGSRNVKTHRTGGKASGLGTTGDSPSAPYGLDNEDR